MIVERYKAPGNKAATISPGNIPQDSRSLEIRGHLAPRQGAKRNPRRGLGDTCETTLIGNARVLQKLDLSWAQFRGPRVETWIGVARPAAHRASEGPFNFRSRTNRPRFPSRDRSTPPETIRRRSFVLLGPYVIAAELG